MDFSTIPVIIEQSLIDRELHGLFKSKQFKIRGYINTSTKNFTYLIIVSSSVPYHSCVFPLSTVVCIIEYFVDIIAPDGSVTEEFNKRYNVLFSNKITSSG